MPAIQNDGNGGRGYRFVGFKMGAWIQFYAKLCSNITAKLEIIHPAQNEPILLPSKSYMINQDIRFHLGSVNVIAMMTLLKGLLKIIAIDDSADVRPAVSWHASEVNELIFSSLSL